MKKNIRWISFVALLLFTFLAIDHAIQPKVQIEANSIQKSNQFDWSLNSERLISSLTNFAHIKGFFVMCLLGLFSFPRNRYLYSFIFLLLISCVTEGLQSWVPGRHGRLMDFIPNLMGMSTAIVLFFSVNLLYRKLILSTRT